MLAVCLHSTPADAKAVLAVDPMRQHGARGLGGSAIAEGKDKWGGVATIGVRLLGAPRRIKDVLVVLLSKQ